MYNIYSMIDKARFHIDFLFFKSQPEDNSEFTKTVSRDSTVYYVPCLRDGVSENHRAIERILTENKYDIIHSHMDASGTDVLRIAKKCGIGIRVAHSHNTGHLQNAAGLKQKLHRAYIDLQRKRLPRYATHFVGCSDAAGQWLFGKRICEGGNYITFKNAVDLESYALDAEKREKTREALGLADSRVIGHVGRFAHQKNHPFLIDVFKDAYDTDRSLRLVLIGDGPDRAAVEQRVREYQIEDAVLFLGRLESVTELLFAFDLFLMPSYYEGLSVALVEAQATGLHCLVSNTCSPESDITGNVEFLPIDRGIEPWTQSIAEYFARGGERNDPSEQIRRCGFDMKTNIKELEGFYECCVSETR